MLTIFYLLLSSLRSSLSTRVALQAEILALRHQLLVLQRSTRGRRLRLKPADRVFWVWLSRRRVLHFTVTAHPTAEWTAQQLIDAFPWDTTPQYLLRDRDGSYGRAFEQTTRAMEIQEVLTAPRSPWQNAYVERLIG